MNRAAIDYDRFDAGFDADILFHVALNTANRFTHAAHTPDDPAAPMPSSSAALLTKGILLGACCQASKLGDIAELLKENAHWLREIHSELQAMRQQQEPAKVGIPKDYI